jgi:hypothetical protein
VTYDGVDIEERTAMCGPFFSRDVPVDPLIVTEGSLQIVEPDKWTTVEHQVAPFALFAMKALFEKQDARRRITLLKKKARGYHRRRHR